MGGFFLFDDRSLSVQTSITQAELQSAITDAIADPLINDVKVTLQSGYILVEGQRQRLNDSTKTDTFTFRVDLGVADGHLTAAVSNVQVDGIAIEQERIDHWNETIANRIENISKRRPNATLQSVAVTPDAVTMDWLVTK